MPMRIASPAGIPRRGSFRRTLWRVRQFGHVISSRPDPAVDATLQRLLMSDAQWRLLARLTPFDRAHHLRVHQLLVEAGHDDRDLLLAALLHDVGKADERGRVHAFHRASHVVLSRFAPGALRRLAVNRGWFRHGLWLSVRHAENGASLARSAGASERCRELIASHGRATGATDVHQVALASADDAAIR